MRRATFNADMSAFLQGVQVNELKEFRCPFYFRETSQSDFGIETVSIWCYRGMLQDPQWLDRDDGKFLVSCVVAS